jgi:N-acetylglutamate synthase-like GNAT family acetyltransferase
MFQNKPVCAFRLDTSADGLGIIRLMAVDQAAQRQGHGRKAISLLTEMAKRAGLKTVEVNSAPDAVAFYQRQGFAMIDSARESPLLRLSLATTGA